MSLLDLLLLASIFLHVISMNLAVGSAFHAIVTLWLGRFNRASNLYRIGELLASLLPIHIAAALIQGVIVFLLMSALLGAKYKVFPLLSESLIVTAFLVLTVLIAVQYWLIYKKNSSKGSMSVWLLLFSGIAMAYFGFWFSHNMNLMMYPNYWSPLSSRILQLITLSNLHGATIIRFLHIFAAFFAVNGLAIGCYGLWLKENKTEKDFSAWAVSRGSLIYAVTTILQFPIGALYYTTLPKEMMLRISGTDPVASNVFIATMTCVLISLVAGFIAARSKSNKSYLVCLAAGLMTIFGMLISRHQLRVFLIAPYLLSEYKLSQSYLLVWFTIVIVVLLLFNTWYLTAIRKKVFQFTTTKQNSRLSEDLK